MAIQKAAKSTTAKKTEPKGETPNAVEVTAFKGFDTDFKCRGYQYEVGKKYKHTGNVSACHSGFHACENPLDIWRYYGPLDAKFAVVSMSGKIDRHEGDSKIASAEITIKAELTLPDFIRRAVAWIIADSGDSSQLAASGDSSHLAASGHSSKLAASGDYSKLAASGHSSQLAASGHSSKLAASGHSSKLAASGDSSQLAASGHSSQLAASGDSSKLEVTGADCVVASAGISTRVKSIAGTWISLAEFDSNNKCIGFATGRAGHDGVPADQWLIARGGKLVAE